MCGHQHQQRFAWARRRVRRQLAEVHRELELAASGTGCAGLRGTRSSPLTISALSFRARVTARAAAWTAGAAGAGVSRPQTGIETDRAARAVPPG